MPMNEQQRCAWSRGQLYDAYHDREWGVPQHDDRVLFEFLNLEGAQAGLSWLTILQKRENYRRAFDRFRAEKIAKYDSEKSALLLKDAGIVRNRLKIQAVILNAQAFLEVRREFGTFDRFIWNLIGGKPLIGSHKKKAVELSVLM